MGSVRSRLFLVLALVSLLPGMAAVIAIGWLSPRQTNQAAVALMQQASGTVIAHLQSECFALGESARLVAAQSEGADFVASVQSAVSRRPDAFAVIIRDGVVVASAGAVPEVPVQRLISGSCSRGSAGSGQVPGRPAAASGDFDVGGPLWAEVVPASDSGRQVGTAVVGTVLDRSGLQDLESTLGLPDGTELALACTGGPAVSTARGVLEQTMLDAVKGPSGSQVTRGYQAEVGQIPQSQRQERGCGVMTAVKQPGFDGKRGLFALVLLAWLGIGLFLIWRLAAGLTRPVLALTEAAERVAAGDLSSRLPRTRDDELGRLSHSFNHMTHELEVKIGELKRSRDVLRENVARLGDTLERTHDLQGLLRTVLAAAVSATGSQRGTAWLVEGGSVVVRAAEPPGAPQAATRRLSLGSGLAGEVASDGLPRRLVSGGDDAATTLGGPALAAPLRRGHHAIGVIVMEREPTRVMFDADDEAMLVSLAGPAGIAVDNVMLHQEAQRLSVTDPLTGAGNLRHMTTTLAREVERASRFDRPLSVLLLDLDHFKKVNDTFGHTVGDAVLKELARRLASCVREVDIVARYGGEEFVVVTPETDTAGAEHLAGRICEAVRGKPFVVGTDQVEVTVSIGIASLPTHGSASGDLVRAADNGLYAAKRAGRDQWQVATTSQEDVVISSTANSSDRQGDR